MARLNLDRITSSPGKISSVFLNTPQYQCESLSKILDCQITIKLEMLNPVRSFKGRGTDLAVANLIAHNPNTVVVCASAGNLGQALAYSGRSFGIPTTVIASVSANPLKLKRIREFGAELHLVPGDFEAARVFARELSETKGFQLIEDSENIDTCEGAATIGLELLQGSDIDVVLVALGGGAMATGIGFVLKNLAPAVQLICVQPAGAPAMTLSWRAGKVIETETADTIADGVAGRCPIPAVLDDLLEVADDTVLVNETSIVRGMRLLYEHCGLVVEPSAALGIAALLENPERFKEARVATILCGGNVNHKDFQAWVQ